MSKHQALETFGRSGNPVFGNKFDGDAQFRDLPVTKKMTRMVPSIGQTLSPYALQQLQ